MSRWPSDTLRIALAPGEAALLRARTSRVLTSPARTAASLLPLLDATLSEPDWQCPRVEVVLSQHFVRQVLTPPPGKALSRTEEQALVAASLREIYGEAAAHWQVQVHSQPPHYGLVGAAVDTALVQQLDALLARHGCRDVHIRPLASHAARHLPARLDGWWVLAEAGWLSVFGGSHGVWHHLAAQPTDADWARALPQLIEREAAQAVLPMPATVWVQALGAGAVAAPKSGTTRWQVLPHDSGIQGALALAGI